MKKITRKTRKLITKMWIIAIILVFLLIGLLLVSEKVYKIAIAENVKERITWMSQQIQSVSSKLVLNTKVNLLAANGKGGVELDWSTYDNNRENI